MRIRIAALAAVSAFACLTAAAPARAQQNDDAMFMYATYFRCAAGMGTQADDAMAKWAKPAYDAAVADGTIKTWGWNAHHTGGDWMRVAYMYAPSLKAVLAANDKLDEKLSSKDNKDNAKWDKAFSEACGSHEDYIWSRVAGGGGGAGKRGSIGFSVYYVCDSGREAEADALMKRVFAPMYDKLVADGKLVSWAWWEHIVGGKYRRLGTMSAANLDALMEARASVNKALRDDVLADALDGICGSHQDYIWNFRISAP